MTKRQNQTDPIDLIVESQDNIPCGPREIKMTKLQIQNHIASLNPHSDLALIHPNLKSDCWKQFGHVEFEGKIATEFVICKDCKIVYNYNPKTGTGTMRKHKCTQEIIQSNKLEDFQFSTQSIISKWVTVPSIVKQLINEAAVQCAAQDMRPISMFGGCGFINLAQTLVDSAAKYGRFEVRSVIAHRTNLTRTHLPNVYQAHMDKILTLMNMSDCISHTLDIWVEQYTLRSYASLACLFIASDFKFRKVLFSTEPFPYVTKTMIHMSQYYHDSMPLPNKLHTVTVDNCSNNNILTNRISCSAHCLNLIVGDMCASNNINMTEISEMIKFVKTLVTWVKRSGLNTTLTKTLKQCCVVRWNSVLIMLKSVSFVWEELILHLSSSGNLKYIEPINKTLLEEVIILLLPFREATDQLEADLNPTLHKVVYWLTRIQRHLEPGTMSTEIENVKEVGRKSLAKKWLARLNDIHFAAILLDPRAKHTPCLSSEQRTRGKYYLQERWQFIANCSEVVISLPTSVSVSNETIIEQDDDFYGPASRIDVRVEQTEFERYMQEPLAARDVDPLQWWQNNQDRFWQLAKVARSIFCVPASSATSERAFSDAGYTINKRRVSLAPQNLNKLLFIRSCLGLPSFDEIVFICTNLDLYVHCTTI